jgi:hypothetical protein
LSLPSRGQAAHCRQRCRLKSYLFVNEFIAEFELPTTKIPDIELIDPGSGKIEKFDFYGQLDAIQGAKNTYYTGGLLNFELVENSIAFSQSLLKRFFGVT